MNYLASKRQMLLSSNQKLVVFSPLRAKTYYWKEFMFTPKYYGVKESAAVLAQHKMSLSCFVYTFIYMIYMYIYQPQKTWIVSFPSTQLSNGTVSAFAKQLNEAHWKFCRGIHHILDPLQCSTMSLRARVGQLQYNIRSIQIY